MADVNARVDAPILRTIALEVLALIRSDAELRKIQGLNAPRASYFDQRSITGAGAANTYFINEALSGNGEVYSSLVITFETASGAGRYRLDGIVSTPTTGVEIPAGGGILVISGHDNIRGFSMIAQAAATLTFARYLYK